MFLPSSLVPWCSEQSYHCPWHSHSPESVQQMPRGIPTHQCHSVQVQPVPRPWGWHRWDQAAVGPK